MKKHNCLTMLPKRYLEFIHVNEGGVLFVKFESLIVEQMYELDVTSYRPRDLKILMKYWEKLGYMKWLLQTN